MAGGLPPRPPPADSDRRAREGWGLGRVIQIYQPTMAGAGDSKGGLIQIDNSTMAGLMPW